MGRLFNRLVKRDSINQSTDQSQSQIIIRWNSRENRESISEVEVQDSDASSSTRKIGGMDAFSAA